MTDQIQQGSEDWFAQRLGKITASRISDLMATIKTGESASKKKYRNELIRERLTGKRIDHYVNSHMDRGTDLEPLARASFEIKTNCFVTQVGFITHPIITMAGASPDGLINDDGLIEIKVPMPETHLDYILDNNNYFKARYYNQVQFQLACLPERKWCDLVSYDPDMPDDLQLHIVRVDRDDDYIQKIETEIIKFDSEITEVILKLKKGK